MPYCLVPSYRWVVGFVYSNSMWSYLILNSYLSSFHFWFFDTIYQPISLQFSQLHTKRHNEVGIVFNSNESILDIRSVHNCPIDFRVSENFRVKYGSKIFIFGYTKISETWKKFEFFRIPDPKYRLSGRVSKIFDNPIRSELISRTFSLKIHFCSFRVSNWSDSKFRTSDPLW